MFQGMKVQKFCSQERKFQRTKVPAKESSMELLLPAAKDPQLELSFQGSKSS